MKNRFILRVSTETEYKDLLFDTYEEALANSIDYLKMTGCLVEFARECDRFLFFEENIEGKKLVDKLEIEYFIEMNEAYEEEEQAEIRRQQGEHNCHTCAKCYEDFGMQICKVHDQPMEDMSGCDDWA